MTQLPLIHLNGTSGKVLVREYADALNAIDNAIAAVSNATCHARDVYPIGEQAQFAYLQEHVARLNKLNAVRAEIYLIYASLLEQMLTRRLNETEDA